MIALKRVTLREPNGRPQRPSVARLKEIEQAERLAETKTVLAQPHRNGDSHPWRVSALGRFCQDHKLRRELHDAAADYANLRRWWGSAVGKPRGFEKTTPRGRGDGPSDETVRGWLRDYTLADIVLRRVSTHGWHLFLKMVVDDEDLPAGGKHDATMVQILSTLAKHMGRVSGRDSAFH